MVSAVDVTVFDVPTDEPEADGTAAWTATTTVVVELRAGDVTGTGWTYAPGACKPLIEQLLAPIVRAGDPMNIAGLWEQMVRRCRNAGRPGLVSTAIAAVDIALWDLKAKLLGLPLCRLLGQVNESVPVYGSGGFTTYDDDTLRRQLQQWVGELGIPRVKIKIGESWGGNVPRDLGRVAVTRSVVGDDVEVYVDANGGYTTGQAVRVAHQLAAYGVVWFEEPVSSDDLAGLAAVRTQIAADVAAGEYAYDLSYVERMCAARAVDCMQLDVTRIAGITDWMRAAAIAAAHNLQVSAHCAPNLHMHPAAAIPNLRHLEYFHDHARIEQLLFRGAALPVGGRLLPDLTTPGHGLALDDPAANAYRTA